MNDTEVTLIMLVFQHINLNNSNLTQQYFIMDKEIIAKKKTPINKKPRKKQQKRNKQTNKQKGHIGNLSALLHRK